MSDEFLVKKHARLFEKCLQVLPSGYAGFQNSRPTVLFFILSSLELLNGLDRALNAETRSAIIDWIYSLQINSFLLGASPFICGFRGSIVSMPSSKCEKTQRLYARRSDVSFQHQLCTYDSSHIAQTYTALCCLLILRDDLTRVDKDATLKSIGFCQLDDGSFCAFGNQNSENDMRFVFCAVSVCFILNDFTTINVAKICEFIRRSVNYDGGIGQGPSYESHGGSTYCAIASLYMLGHLWDASALSAKQMEHLRAWALRKQDEGFHGRTNKPDDSCYAFWIGATLSILNAHALVDRTMVRSFLMRTQDETIGGFSKYEDSTSDVLHTYFSIAALSIFDEPLVQPVFAPLNISQRAYGHLLRLRALSTYVYR